MVSAWCLEKNQRTYWYFVSTHYLIFIFVFDIASGEDGNSDSCSSVRNQADSQQEKTAEETETEVCEDAKEETKSSIETSEISAPDDSSARQDSVSDMTEEITESSENVETADNPAASNVEMGSSGWREVTVSGGE